MLACVDDLFYRFRPPKEQTGDPLSGSHAEDEIQAQVPDDGEYILCRQCLNAITHPSEAIVIDGAHRHTFANPHGIVFEIGCFRSAGGCGYAGPTSNEFTWFKGFSWKVAVCSRCLAHLGWRFVSAGFESFHGLIFDRLLTQKQGQPGRA